MPARLDIGWYKRFPDKALAGMLELNLEQRGAYGTIIDLIYSRAGDLPVDMDLLKRHLQVNARVVKRLLDELCALDKIQIIEGRIRTRRSDVEIDTRISTIKAQSDGGKEGANRRWNGNGQGSFEEVSAKFEQKLGKNSAKTPEKLDDFFLTIPANSSETQSENERKQPNHEKVSHSDTHPTRARESESESEKESTSSTESLESERVQNPFDDDDGIIGKLNTLARIAGLNLTVPRNLNTALDQLKTWEGEGIDFETTIAPVIRERSAANPTEPVYSLRYFDAAVRKRHGLQSEGVKAPEPVKPSAPKPPIEKQDDDDPRISTFRERLAKATGVNYATYLAPEHVAVTIADGRLLRVWFRSDPERATGHIRFENAIAHVARSIGLSMTLEVVK